MAIAASFVAPNQFAVAADKVARFVAKRRVLADCGDDGERQGVVASVSGTTVTLVVDGDTTLTANLISVQHGSTTTDSLANHGHTGLADGGQIAHTSLSSIGTNTHAQIDTHLANTSNPHGVTAAQVGAIPATTGAATAYVSNATTSAAGKVHLTTTAEAQAGTDTAKAMTAAGTAAAILAATGSDPGDIPKIEILGTAAYLDQTWLYASATWEAGSCANAAQVSTTVAAPGAAIGDKVFPSAAIALSGLNLRGEVTAADVVTLYLSNLTGAAINLASATYYIAVLKRIPTR